MRILSRAVICNQAACVSASGLCFQSGNITSAFIISDALLRILFIFCTHSIAFDTLSCSFTPSLFAIDYTYITAFIKAQEKLSIKSVIDWKDKKNKPAGIIPNWLLKVTLYDQAMPVVMIKSGFPRCGMLQPPHFKAQKKAP